jgi:ubiquinone/menaquinone biosynthesis C-methylase UbiE
MTTSATPALCATNDPENLPVPHRCPWFMQYILVSPLRRLLEPADKLLAPHVRPGMTVLEPGCGMGYFSLPLARMVGHQGRVHCVDVEPRAIDRLKRRARRADLHERITTHVCTPSHLGLDDHAGRVDLVLVMHTLHEFDDLPGFIEQITPLLAPEGRMFVVEPAGHVKPAQFEAMMSCCEAHGLRVIERPKLSGKRLAALLTLA